jgi:hypothetical protein
MNAGGEDDNQRQGCTVLVCKVKLQKKKQVEMLAWNKDIPVHAWVDGDAMIFIAKGFVEHKRGKHGRLASVLVCDNLKLHLIQKSSRFCQS